MFNFFSKASNSKYRLGSFLSVSKSLNKVFLKNFSISSIPRGSSTPYEFKENDLLHGFKILKIEDIPDYSIKAFTLEHEQTKARYLHLHSPDENNTFAALFRTVPLNDKGAPHILEHFILCGSEKYPVRDPFINMSKRSLNSHMNAWTGADYTSYPFSTQNEKDFNNLLNVYSDVIFKPIMNYYDFLQEGWRFDFQEDNNKNNLNYRGVVFNEMKGIYQTPDNLFEEYIQKYLFTNSPYRLSSGGQPKEIVKLSYEELKEFYKRHYHPSNASFFSYGDLDFTKTLKYLNEKYLSKYQYQEANTEIPAQQKFDNIQEVKVKSPPEAINPDPKRQTKFALSYLCNDVVDDTFTSISLNILSYLLFETPNSIFYKVLLESGIAEGYCPGYGYDMSTKESTFTIGVRNIESEYRKLMDIEIVINETLFELVDKGFDKDFIESVLHQVEVQAKLPKSDFGINVLQSLTVLLNHKGDSTFLLKISENINKLRRILKKEKYFEGLIKKYLIDNKHKLRLIMTPDNDLILDELEAEKKSLKKIEKILTEEQKNKIIADNKALKKRQEELIDINILPTLNLDDIPKKGQQTKFQTIKIQDIPVSFIEQPTNGLTFFRMKFNIKEAPIFIRPYIRMFCEFFTKLGTKTIKHDKLYQLLDLYTFNFELNHLSFSSSINVEESNEYIVMTIACLDKNIENMFNLVTDLFLHADFNDYTNLSQLIKIHSSEAANSFVENSLDYALNYATSGFRESVRRSDKLTSSRFLCDFGANFLKTTFVKDSLEEVNFHLIGINNYLLRKDIISFAVNSSQDMFDQVQRRIDIMLLNIKSEKSGFLGSSNKKSAIFDVDEQNQMPIFSPIMHKSHFVLPMQVNYIVESVPIPHYTHPDTPKLHILCKIISL